MDYHQLVLQGYNSNDTLVMKTPNTETSNRGTIHPIQEMSKSIGDNHFISHC